jgi:acetyl-CoA carboxylase beta subunit
VSASAWTRCPQCEKNRTDALIAREEKIVDSYGQVSISEFMATMEQLELDKQKAQNPEPTFREDYHVTGAEEGVVTFTYSGGCKVCNLEVKRFVVECLIYPILGAPVMVPTND